MSDFIKSVFAGLMIGIAGLVYLSVEIAWIGSILFSIGLIIVCILEYNLYTGKVGYIKSYKDIPKMFKYVIGNFIGVFLISLTTTVSSMDIVAAKLEIPYYLLLLKSIGCGLLMYIAVDIYKNNKSIIGVLCCVPAFILAGFEHSIADMFYFAFAMNYSGQMFLSLFIIILGNFVGGSIIHLLRKVFTKKN